MPFATGSAGGAQTATGPTTILAGAAGRQVQAITVTNTDTVAATVVLYHNVGGTARALVRRTLAVGESLPGNGFLALPVGDSLEIKLAAATTTAGLDWSIDYGDLT